MDECSAAAHAPETDSQESTADTYKQSQEDHRPSPPPSDKRKAEAINDPTVTKRMSLEAHRGTAREPATTMQSRATATLGTDESIMDVVLIGDYNPLCVSPSGDLNLIFLATSTGEASEDAAKVQVWAHGSTDSGKYYEKFGSDSHAAKTAEGAWLPQIIADELHERLKEEGPDSVPRGEFIEEASNDNGDSLLVVDHDLLIQNISAFGAMLRAKRGLAKRVIKRFFRTVRPRGTKKIAEAFCLDCTTLDEAVNTQFEELSSKLREDKVVSSAKDMLFRLIQLANWMRAGKPLISGNVNVKIYLAAYMIAARPNHVFESIGDLERKVLDASKPMLQAFHKTAQALSGGHSWNSVRKDVAATLPSLLCTYLRTFKEWKLVDEKKLAGRLTHALKGLEQAERGLKDDEADSKIRGELQAQQKRLREKLAQIAGEKAVQAHDAEQKAGGGASSSRSVQAATVSRDIDGGVAVAAPAGHVGGMTNEQLAHELLLDKDFRLDEKAGMSDDKLVHTKIRETFERAFWESLVEDLSTLPPTYARVLSVLTEIKTGIESLSQGQPQEKRIGDVIDMDKITEMLRQNKLDYLGCETLIAGIVDVLISMHDRMRSPERHKETVTNWQEVRTKMREAIDRDQEARARATCAALELVLDRVHAVRVDTANNKLKAIAPVIREHGVEYEKSHFAKKLDKNIVTLERTNLWIAHTLKDIASSNDTRVSVADLGKGKPEDFEVVLYVAMVNLIADYPNWGGVSPGHADEDVVPETMMLDLLRIKALNMHFHTDVVSSVILVTAEAQCREHIKDVTARTELFKNVQDIVVRNPPKPNNPRVTIRLVVNALQRSMNKPMLDECQNVLDKNVKKTSAVHAAMTKIFKRVWYHLVKDKEVPSSCKVPECARPLLVEVAKHTGSLATVALHNKKVHVVRYNNIIKTEGDKINNKVTPAAAGEVGKKRPSPERDDIAAELEMLKKKRI